ncbi:XRE family transcriptional regulator [Kibdelosporangium philippinense]|uniref:XRE family transcriptional regulator n=1 Tax=Kibdelosporangium philippinense TaxID=211113 RepID=A0ABS8Z1K8_9PSEU|nr:XRE family transcriptional regulator [Kibdelosporangium philippinense]MCE7001821.1 XRE family transcriptional regulator [Kibdelosporangium philippinense]
MAEGLTGLEALGLDELAESTSEDLRSAEVGARVAAARHRAGMTGTELGAAVGLRKDQISKIESGKRRLDVGELPGIAAALGVTVRYLLGQSERPGLAMAARLAAGVGPEATRSARRRARQLLELDDLLGQVAGMPPARPSQAGAVVLEQARSGFTVRPRSKVTAQAQGLELAELTRRELDLGSDALGDLAALLEQHFAVDVALSPLGTDADGLCVHGEHSALILASSDFPDGHLRFTLAHELAHHLLGDPREVIEEIEHDMFAGNAEEWRANAFAAHLLMPERGIRSVLEWLGAGQGQVSERAVVALMEHFGVSMAALVYQLNTIGVIDYEAGKRLRDQNRVRTLISRHRDVAPTEAATIVRRVHRAPERLARHALAAVRAQRLGLSVVAALLERDDDEHLWESVMGDIVTDGDNGDDIVL